jgi:hypothetical protein
LNGLLISTRASAHELGLGVAADAGRLQARNLVTRVVDLLFWPRCSLKAGRGSLRGVIRCAFGLARLTEH